MNCYAMYIYIYSILFDYMHIVLYSQYIHNAACCNCVHVDLSVSVSAHT